MIALPRETALQYWDKFWNEMTGEFFKVEDLQSYADEKTEQQSSLSLWLAGERDASLTAMQAHQSEWAAHAASKKVRKVRIHVVDEPYSEYLRWEIAHYRMINIPLGGEEVFLVNRVDVPEYDLGDFMMFDERRVTKSNYSEGGRLESMDIYQDELIQKFMDAKRLLLKFAKRV